MMGVFLWGVGVGGVAERASDGDEAASSYRWHLMVRGGLPLIDAEGSQFSRALSVDAEARASSRPSSAS